MWRSDLLTGTPTMKCYISILFLGLNNMYNTTLAIYAPMHMVH